jgi:hypothetical protein
MKIDAHLQRNIHILQNLLELELKERLIFILIEGARTEDENIEYYQNKYGENWKKYYNSNSLHIVKESTGNILKAMDIAFKKEDGSYLPGRDILKVIQDNFLFSNVGVAENYVHVDVMIRTWYYKN